MQDVICPECGHDNGECEDDGDDLQCEACGAWFHVDEVEDGAEMYAHQEEEDRERWIPGYKEAKEELLALEEARWQGWKVRDRIPAVSPRLAKLRERFVHLQRQRPVPPWEKAAP